MKKTILLLLFPLAALTTMAQNNESPGKKFQFGIGLGAGVYTDNASVINASLEVQGEDKVAKAVSLYCGLAYNRMISFDGDGSAGYASLLAGPRVWFSENFFIGFSGGVAFFSDGVNSDAVFNYNLNIGLDTKKCQFTLGYNGLSDSDANIGLIQLRAIVKLK